LDDTDTIDYNTYKDSKISSNLRNIQLNSSFENHNVNEISCISNNNNSNKNLTQIQNQVNNNYSNNSNNIHFIGNNQEQPIPNNNTSHSQSQFQHHKSGVYLNNPNISTQQPKNTFNSNKISAVQQMPFNPIIQNNSTIINNYINILPPMTTDLVKDLHINQNQNNNLNNSQYQNNHSVSSFNKISFQSGGNPENISSINLIYQNNGNLMNNININTKIGLNQKKNSNHVLTPNIFVQNCKTNERSNNNQYIKQDENKYNYIDKDNIYSKCKTNISFYQSVSEIDYKNEIILPPSDDFIPPLPPENPPEPDTTKFDKFEQFSALREENCIYNKERNQDEQLGRMNEEKVIDYTGQIISYQQLEKTEPGQILNYDSEDGYPVNINIKKLNSISKKIDVKNAPINFKKYNLSRSSSSSSHSNRKRDYLNKKRDREKIRRYSRERDREKEKKKKKHKSRSKERNTNNISSINTYKPSNAITSKRDSRDCKDNIPRNGNSKKYQDGNKKYYKQDNRSCSSSSSFQSGKNTF